MHLSDPVNREPNNGYFRDAYFAKSTWVCFFMPVGGYSRGRSHIDEYFTDLEGWVRYVRTQQKLAYDAPLPAFLVVHFTRS